MADELVRRVGARIVLTGGPGEEETVRAVEQAMRCGTALNLAGRTTIGSLAAVLARLDLLVGNDTGPAHLAEAVGTPTVRLFGPADPRRWAPLDSTRHRVVRKAVACSPCGYWECPIDHRCLRRISVERVVAEALDLAQSLAVETAAEGLTATRPAYAGRQSVDADGKPSSSRTAVGARPVSPGPRAAKDGVQRVCEDGTPEEGAMAWSA